MNTISSGMIGQMMAMDGRSYFNTVETFNPQTNRKGTEKATLTASSEEVAQNITDALAQTKADVQELQKLSDLTMGHKLQFNVNDELGEVIVKVVDPRTDEVLKEIPSKEIQNLQVRMRHAMSILFDETI